MTKFLYILPLFILSCMTLHGQSVNKGDSIAGWYGNTSLSAGALLYPSDKMESFINRNKFLYNGNLVISKLSEYDQFVFTICGYNAVGDKTRVSGASKKGITYNPYSTLSGLQSQASVGANYKTERLRFFSAEVTASYKHNTKDGMSVFFRDIRQSDGNDMYSIGVDIGYGIQDEANILMSFKNKDQRKYVFDFNPSFLYVNSSIDTEKESAVYTIDETILNKSSSKTKSSFINKAARGDMTGGIKNISKTGRSIMAKFRYGLDDIEGGRRDISPNKEMAYKLSGDKTSIVGSIAYEEPIGERWLVKGNIESEYTKSNEGEIAYDKDGNKVPNYTSSTENLFYREKFELLVQYYNTINRLQVGLHSSFRQSVTSAMTKDVYVVSGEGEWMDNWIPFVNYDYRKNRNTLSVKYEGTSSGVTMSDITPNLNISNPTRITAGNIYLKPSFKHILKTQYRYSNKETQSLFDISVQGTNENGKVVSAIWYDNKGIRYSVPVNTQKPGFSSVMDILFDMPFGKGKQFVFSIKGKVKYNSNISYQAKGKLPGINLDKFNYDRFITQFWGGPSGDVFYSGKSGFNESFTRSINSFAELKFGYKTSRLYVDLTVSANRIVSKYSFDPIADEDVWNNVVANQIKVTPGRGWEIINELKYKFYFGYSDGYGTPETIWNLNIGKKIKALTIALTLDDILNQKQNLSYKVKAEYAETSWLNVLGRHFLLSFSYDFGKLPKSGRDKINKVADRLLK